MRFAAFVVIGALALSLASCADTNLTKGQQGAVGGAAAGAVIGQAIGNEMDKYDRMQLNNAYESGPSGQPVSWVNPDSGTNYQVVPQPAYQNSKTNQVCRQADVMVTIDGQPQNTKTTACRNDQGQWQLQ